MTNLRIFFHWRSIISLRTLSLQKRGQFTFLLLLLLLRSFPLPFPFPFPCSMKYSLAFLTLSLSANHCFIITSEIWLSVRTITKIDCNYPSVLICANHLWLIRSGSKCCENLLSWYILDLDDAIHCSNKRKIMAKERRIQRFGVIKIHSVHWRSGLPYFLRLQIESFCKFRKGLLSVLPFLFDPCLQSLSSTRTNISQDHPPNGLWRLLSRRDLYSVPRFWRAFGETWSMTYLLSAAIKHLSERESQRRPAWSECNALFQPFRAPAKSWYFIFRLWCKWLITICGETPKNSDSLHAFVCRSMSIAWTESCRYQFPLASLGGCYERSLDTLCEPLSPIKTPASFSRHLLHSSSPGDWNFLEWKPIFQKEKVTCLCLHTSRDPTFSRCLSKMSDIFLARF
jgi:hypothetical protein